MLFDAAPEYVELGFDITVPKYGSLTVRETIALDQFLNPEMLAFLDESELLATLYLRTVLAALLLVARHSPHWNLNMAAELPLDVKMDVSAFLLGERNQWKTETPKPREDDAELKPIDWDEMFLRLQNLYPTVEQFRAERFLDCPVALIEKALTVHQQQELQRMNLNAAPIALLGVYLLSAQGAKNPQTRWINPFERMIAKSEAKDTIEPELAQFFLAQTKAGKVPGWAIEQVDVDKIRLAAS